MKRLEWWQPWFPPFRRDKSMKRYWFDWTFRKCEDCRKWRSCYPYRCNRCSRLPRNPRVEI